MTINLFVNETRKQLRWMNRPKHWEFIALDALTIIAPPKSDFFQDPSGKHIASSAPFLSIPAGDSFELTTRVRVDMRHIYDSGCLMLMMDDRNWAKLCFEFNGQHPIIVSVVTREGVSDDCYSVQVTVDKPYLRITKQNNCVTFSYSEDGANWMLIRYFGMNECAEYVAGVVAQSPQGEGCTVEFDYLNLSELKQESRF
ncbi:DUF1349 domain-containing protein [Paenibacillus sp.]|uniref:DUF1349 domain-containing protein n=1 Tax=Paenibacillus sp. TaxID=58172 RepID=UPI0028A733F8|nr:DUF1349 domain-containing protein [Paenibacillus sp.]